MALLDASAPMQVLNPHIMPLQDTCSVFWWQAMAVGVKCCYIENHLVLDPVEAEEAEVFQR